MIQPRTVAAAGHVQPQLQTFIELRSSAEGYYVNARNEGAPDQLPLTFVGVLGSRDEAISEVARWALGWRRRLEQSRQSVPTPRPAINDGRPA